jgi:hypothetical protein
MSNPLQQALDNPFEAPEFAQAGDMGPELDHQGEDDYERFPPGCPVKVLGNQQDVSGKQSCYYLNWNGQLVGLEAGNRHGKLGLAALFGPSIGWLEAHYPMWSKPVREQIDGKWVIVQESKVIGFDQAKAAQALVIESVRRGIFDPAGRMRGRGAHRPEKGIGGLVLHCGNKILVSVPNAEGAIKGWRWIDAGEHERYVYQAAEPMPRPWHDHVGPKPARKLKALLETWNWKRKELDPILCLGAIGASMLGGALPWRPHIWITGGRGTGKSTLNGRDQLIHKLFGTGLFRTSNTTAAGIRSHLKNSTVPVMIDEREAERDNRKNDEIIELARIASSGDTATRGSSDHSGVEFTLQSCFWFSSILIPPLQPQDRSRLAILELLPIPEGAVPPEELVTTDFGTVGRQLMKRMVEGWSRLAETKLKYHAALALAGHDNRACDQFGTLLACADVLLADNVNAVPSDIDVAHWVGHCRPQRMAEVTETTADHDACLQHILTSMVQARGGDEREQLATWIFQALSNSLNHMLDINQVEKSHHKLHQLGLKLVNAKRHPEKVKDGKSTPARWGAVEYASDAPGYLAVATGKHGALLKLFEGTEWQSGVWAQSLARVPGHLNCDGVKFGHFKSRAVLIPLAAVFDDEDLPTESKPERAADWVREQLQELG